MHMYIFSIFSAENRLGNILKMIFHILIKTNIMWVINKKTHKLNIFFFTFYNIYSLKYFSEFKLHY